MMVEMDYEGKIILIVNIHAPTGENENGGFFKVLKEFLNKYKEVIMMGDFNTVFSKLDMAEGMVFKTDKGRKELKSLMEEYDIVDVWRERNENKKEYTRRQLVGDFMCKTRIDLILCTRNIEGFICNIKFEETSFSDHKMISMRMDWNQMERGPGVWVLNTEILREENYVLEVKEIIEKEKENRMYTEDKRIWWENVKYSIKKFTIKNCTLIQKSKSSKEREIRKKLKEELEGNGNDIQKIKELEGALKEIEEEKYEVARLRSKAKYTVEGEKCTVNL
ncbi:MAG: endonuclease/exonuclease/phosphatase family protein [Fusobacteriaceae bacterium]